LQEDSHEFLRCLLYALHKHALLAAGCKEGRKDRLDETSFIYNIFGGYFQSTTHCTNPGCGFDSNTFDSFLDLCLEVGNGIRSVPEALRHFSSTETLDAANKWKCPRCTKAVCAQKRMTIRKVRERPWVWVSLPIMSCLLSLQLSRCVRRLAKACPR
jgi:ubiquitin carboxyl-terminal hydrolase 36/42